MALSSDNCAGGIMTRSIDGYEIRLKNTEGVPVIYIAGNLSSNSIKAINFLINGLCDAGHFNMIIDIQHAYCKNWAIMNKLSNAICAIKEHYGSVNFIASKDIFQSISGLEGFSKLVKFAISEPEAIARIKRLIRAPEKLHKLNAHLVES